MLIDTRQLVELAAFVSGNLPHAGAFRDISSSDFLQRGWMAIRGLQRSWVVDLGRVATSANGIAPTLVCGAGLKPVLPTLQSRMSPGMRTSPEAEEFPAHIDAAGLAADIERMLPDADSDDRRWVDAASEFCVAEPAIRTWCAALCLVAEHSGQPAPRQIAGQLAGVQNQVRGRILVTLGQRSTAEATTAAINRLRRIGERWTDTLVGALCLEELPDGLAIDVDRAADFSEELSIRGPQRRVAWDVALASLRTVYPAFPWSNGVRQQLAHGLAQSLLGLLPPELFLDAGNLVPSWWSSLTAYRHQ